MSEEDDSVGSVAEEAMKLLSALQDWAKESASSDGTATAGASWILSVVADRLADESKDCKYCPVCQLIATLREVHPEVHQHLNRAFASLLLAGAELLGKRPAGGSNGQRTNPVQHIDLADSDDLDGPL